jgi:hypothetical protein
MFDAQFFNWIHLNPFARLQRFLYQLRYSVKGKVHSVMDVYRSCSWPHAHSSLPHAQKDVYTVPVPARFAR